MSDNTIVHFQDAASLAREEQKINDTGALAVGPSAPGVFKSAAQDFDLLRILSMIGHRAAEVGEALATARSMKDGDFESWTREWQSLGERIEKIANNCLSHGHRVSAREAFLRASSYYLVAFFYLADTDKRKRPLYQRHVACFDAACPLFEGVFEPVSIPYEGKSLPGYFIRPDASGKPRPTVILQNGGDGTAAQLYALGGGAGAISRGYNALLFDGPGQSGAYLRDSSLLYRPDWEVPIKAVVDFLVARSEVDASRLALTAYSFGGYLGTRAVAFEKRISAYVAGCILSDGHQVFTKALGLGDEFLHGPQDQPLTDHQTWGIYEVMPRFGYHNGVKDVSAFLERLKAFNLSGLEDQITCPVLNLSTTSEGWTMYGQSKSFFNKLKNPKNRFVLNGSELGAEHHCLLGNVSLLEQLQFDWLDEVFGL